MVDEIQMYNEWLQQLCTEFNAFGDKYNAMLCAKNIGNEALTGLELKSLCWQMQNERNATYIKKVDSTYSRRAKNFQNGQGVLF